MAYLLASEHLAAKSSWQLRSWVPGGMGKEQGHHCPLFCSHTNPGSHSSVFPKSRVGGPQSLASLSLLLPISTVLQLLLRDGFFFCCCSCSTGA
jgi:hypothetical protein